MQGLACGALAALAPATALQLAILLLPSIVVAMLESAPGKPVARAVLLCALATCVEPVRELWNYGQGLGDAWASIANIHALALAWAASAGGWLMTQLIPLGVGFALETTASARMARLEEQRQAVIREWGLEAPADQ
ncbi:MAG: hypothetical protein AB7S57_13175 [Acetobacteraceae bacterium]